MANRNQSSSSSRSGRRRRSLAIFLGALAAIAVGSLSVSTGTSGAATSKMATAGTATSRAASTVVTSKTDPRFGPILADGSGMTLYTLVNNGLPVPCTGVCAGVWPPLTVPTPATPVTGPPGVIGLSTMSNANGSAVTYQGEPLYRFAGDSSPSDSNGDGIVSFGGTWHVVPVTSSSSPSG